MFSNEEKRDMLRMYYLCQRNGTEAEAAYLQRYPERRQPHRSLFLRLDYNISHFGTLRKPRRKYGSRVTQEETALVLNEV